MEILRRYIALIAGILGFDTALYAPTFDILLYIMLASVG